MKRNEELEKIRREKEFDILIIGGGATGLGCAVDAASRGFKTLLLEKYDFSKGTSSRSTKLLHGGVRYLAQGNIRLVREALLERGRLLRNAPHICHSLPFVVPVYKRWQKWYYGFGLWMYEFLSGKLSLGKTKLLSKEETLNYLPDLETKKLAGGILYFDGQFDDSRLAIDLARTAIEQGAVVINYFGVTDFIKNGNKITGVNATDEISGNAFKIKAKVVINATGAFADKMLQLAEGHAEESITPSQGIHLVVDKNDFRSNAAMLIPKTDDGRVLFAIPWYDKLLLGTTDTPIANITTEPKPFKEEIEFIINQMNRYDNSDISIADVKSVFAGIRPLAKVSNNKKTAAISRDYVIKVLPSGLVQITGGKWTTYRSMAEHAVDKAIQAAGLPFSPTRTKKLKIHGFTGIISDSHLSVYGVDEVEIIKLMRKDISLSEKIHPDYPYTKAEVKWIIDNEMAVTVEDILTRRIRLLFLDAKAAIEAAPVVADMLAIQTGHTAQWKEEQIRDFTELAQGYLINY